MGPAKQDGRGLCTVKGPGEDGEGQERNEPQEFSIRLHVTFGGQCNLSSK